MTNENILIEVEDESAESVNEAMNRYNLQEDFLKASDTIKETTETTRPSVIVDTTPNSFVQIEKSKNFLSDYC
jgi:hypothetical protein